MTGKPIIFLCHSLGGIVVKRAISYSKERTGEKVSGNHDVFSSTHGLLFFGTPHQGSNVADWLYYFESLAALTSTHLKSSLVKALRRESETLQDITDHFVPLMKRFNIFLFWEEEKMRLPGKLVRKYIVTSESAAPIHLGTERAGIAANHSNMVKFDDASSQGFRTVVDAITRYCKDASSIVKLRNEHAARCLYEERRFDVLQTLQHTRFPASMAAGGVLPTPTGQDSDCMSQASTLAVSGRQDQEMASLWDKAQEDVRGDLYSESCPTLI